MAKTTIKMVKYQDLNVPDELVMDDRRIPFDDLEVESDLESAGVRVPDGAKVIGSYVHGFGAERFGHQVFATVQLVDMGKYVAITGAIWDSARHSRAVSLAGRIDRQKPRDAVNAAWESELRKDIEAVRIRLMSEVRQLFPDRWTFCGERLTKIRKEEE